MDKTHHREGTSVTPMRHTSLGTNAQMMVMMQSFRSSAEKKSGGKMVLWAVAQHYI